jgi:hypothetical protein
VSDRISLTTPLLSNYACRVAQRGTRRLYFNCGGLVVTAMLLLSATIGVLAVVAFYLLVQAGGNASEGLIGALLGVSFAFWSGYLAITRYRQHGHFEVDAETGVLRRYRGGRQVGEFRLRDVRRVWLALDVTDTLHLDALPSWLQIGLTSGEVFRLAKGTREELQPVCEAMRRLGLALT